MSSESPPPFRPAFPRPQRRGPPSNSPGDDLYDAPSHRIAGHDPQMVERLGELDDVVFEAIAGRAAAVERLPTLWTEVLQAVGPDLVDESRQAYCDTPWPSGKNVPKPSRRGIRGWPLTLMDVLAILLDDRALPRPKGQGGLNRDDTRSRPVTCRSNLRNCPNRYWLSCGPADASGWYCTQKAGAFLWRRPSIVPSFRLRCVTSKSAGSVASSTAKPWFCDVISTTPVCVVHHRLVRAAVAELRA